MTESGLQAEAVTFFGPDDLDRFVLVKDSAQQLLYKKPAGKPMGVRETDGKYINRPETIEYVKSACSARLPTVADPVAAFGRSVFYMYRLTGDKSWQEKGWRMFTAWMDNSLVDNGIASIADVRRRSGVKIDNMERCAASPPPRARVQLLTPFPPFIIEPSSNQFCPGRNLQVRIPLARRSVRTQSRRLRAQHRSALHAALSLPVSPADERLGLEQKRTLSASTRPSDPGRKNCGRASLVWLSSIRDADSRLTLTYFLQALGRALSSSVCRVGRVPFQAGYPSPALGYLQAAAEA